MLTNQNIIDHFRAGITEEQAKRSRAILRGKTDLSSYNKYILVYTAAIEAGKTCDCGKIPDGILNGNTRLDTVLKLIGVSDDIIQKLFV
jgi:hypothetical protein